MKGLNKVIVENKNSLSTRQPSKAVLKALKNFNFDREYYNYSGRTKAEAWTLEISKGSCVLETRTENNYPEIWEKVEQGWKLIKSYRRIETEIGLIIIAQRLNEEEWVRIIK